MKAKSVVVACAVMSAVGVAQERADVRESAGTAGRKLDSPKAQVAASLARGLIEREFASGSRLEVAFAGETALGVTVTDRDGRGMTLDFVRNETSEVLRPVLPEDTVPEVFGRPVAAWLLWLMRQGPNARGSLEPFDATTPQLPHDDVTVFVVDRELVLLFLWNRGDLIGTYYAIDTDAAEQHDRVRAPGGEPDDVGGAVAAVGTPKDAVCGKLLRWCTGPGRDWPTLVACLGWLFFCQ